MTPRNEIAMAEGESNITSERERWQAANLSAETFQLLERDSQAFLHQSLSTPCLNALRSTNGSWIEDVEGRRYLDFHGNSVHQVGYGHPKVVAAIKKQLDVMPFCPRRYTNEPAIRLAEKLADLAPGKLNKVLLAPGGTNAIGIALKLARLATGKHKVVSLWDSFHGASLDAISVGGEELFRRDIGPMLPGVEHVPPPDPRRCPLGCGSQCSLACANYLSYVVDKEGDVGAVIAEPIRCTTAVAPPPGYWRMVREACDRHGALLIFDEIPVALGRTGAWFACEWTGVVPDVLVIGKGLGGGIFPMAAVIAHEDLDVGDEIALGHYTHEKSPVGSAAGLATIEAIEEEDLLTRSRVEGARFLRAIKDFTANSRSVLEVRGIGLLIGVEMAEPRTAEAVLYESLSRGLSFKVSSGTVLTLTPPLTITTEELDMAIETLCKSITAAETGGVS
ncbi:MAG TPA: aspartate aminotransferase family protein [Fimbriimonas sp.]|nr:aspartate aminotransferase family protein [Fimbriimonas sp.]